MIRQLLVPSLCLIVSANAQQFRSEYTDFDNCEWVSEGENGGDGTQECKGINEYYVFEYYSTSATIRKIKSRTNDEFEILVLPEDADGNIYSITDFGKKIEWRYYGTKPIAIIYRVSISDSNGNMANKREYLLVRGLYRYSQIDDDIDVKSTKNPNAHARKVLDSLYTEYYLKGETPWDPL